MIDIAPKKKRDILLNLAKKKMPFVRQYVEPCAYVVSNISDLLILNNSGLTNNGTIVHKLTIIRKLSNFKSPFGLRKRAYYLLTNSSSFIGKKLHRFAEPCLFFFGNFSELVTVTNQVVDRGNSLTDFAGKVGTGLPCAVSVGTGIIYAGRYLVQGDFVSAIGMTTSVVCEGATCYLVLKKSDYGLGKILIPLSGFSKNLVKINRNIQGDPVTLKQLSGFKEVFELPLEIGKKNDSCNH